MRKKTLLPIMAILLSSAPLFAQSSTIPSNGSPIPVIPKVPIRDTTDRPKAPSRQSIDCFYMDGNLTVSFLYPEGDCRMTVTDSETGMSLQYSFPTEEPAEIYIGTLSNAYLEFETEAGFSYEGWIKE